jgi:energy-coupling factor transporter ATP-binding protein EcfA2
LSGSFSEVKAPLQLLDTKSHGTALKEEREREQARQEERKKEALLFGKTELSQDKASDYLSNAIDNISHEIKGSRHNTVLGQSFWIGRVVAGDNGLDYYSAQSALENAVRVVFASEPTRLSTELKTARDGLEQGMKDPFFIRRTPQAEAKETPSLQPATSSFSSLDTLRPCLGNEVTLALSKTETTVLVAPTGSGKTTYAINALVEQCQGKKMLWACYSKEERDRVARLLREHGLSPFVAEGRDYKNCANLDNYLYASTLERTCGAQWCKQICLHNKRNGGTCRPPSPPKDTQIVVCTHALAKPTTSHFEPDVLVWDEGAISGTLKTDTEALGRAIGEGEITGDTTDRLLALMAESGGRKIEASETQEAITGLNICLDEERRDGLFGNLCREGSRPEKESAINWRFLEALQICSENEGLGGRIVKGELRLSQQPLVPDAHTRLILDATATKLASLATYGPHEWRCLSLTSSEHTTHLHINCNGGKSTRRSDGSWEVQRTKRLHDALTTHLPDALHIEFKGWTEQEQTNKESTYYGSTEAKGSNKWSDRAAVIAWDNYVPKEEKDALVLSWIEGLKGQGIEPNLEQLQKESVWQFEVAPMMQAVGRIRPYAATPDKPKTIITIGQKKRVPDLGEVTKSIEWDEALFEMTGEITRRVASRLLPKLATQRGGLFYKDLQEAESFTLFNEISNGQWEYSSPRIYKGFCILIAHPRFHWEKWSSTLSDAWNHQTPHSMLFVVPRKKQSGAAQRLRYLPPSPKDFSGIEERAKKEEWLGWTVFDQNGAELKRVDCVETAFSRLPFEAQFWNVGKILEWVSKESGCSNRTAKDRMSKAGGVKEIRQKLSSQPTPSKPIISKLKPKKEPISTPRLVQVVRKPKNQPRKPVPKTDTKERWTPPTRRKPLPLTPTISCDPKSLLEAAKKKGYPSVSIWDYGIETGRRNWLEYLEFHADFLPVLEMVALALRDV